MKLEWFKVGIMILGIAFLFIYYQSTTNGRYAAPIGTLMVLDTRTGAWYEPEKGGVTTQYSKPVTP